jgi:hypothetical protein
VPCKASVDCLFIASQQKVNKNLQLILNYIQDTGGDTCCNNHCHEN